MMEITREMKMKMFGMKLDGKTPFEIAKETGCSAREVAEVIGVQLRASYPHKKWVYPGLGAWMHENCINIRSMANMCGVNTITVQTWLCGKNDIMKQNVDRILRVTGLTYEEAFGDPRKTD